MAILENQMWDLAAVNKGQPLHAKTLNHKQRLAKINAMVADWNHRIEIAKPRCRQVKHLIEKFGGILPFAVACNRHPNHIIYKWLGVTKDKRVLKDRWGLVPSWGILMRLIAISRLYGVVLTPEDLLPDIVEGGMVKNPHANPELMAWAMSIEPGGGTTKESMQKLETEIAALLDS